ncbi:DUF3087 domain-containing protein [Marinobacterium arenosum]|uniref:DUF3087 domain-containing protein n=1 Tax=Marinobacterium arenosum TaxID=2862496 RepID=UPI001C937659|nr:DUF3087 domain-containing protein [Marinobacterium arenosum]MBY4678043.1 DUF3087 domain-containing protein [Marinobacterium arenosum]
MQLQQIDKDTYSKHYKLLFIGVAGLMLAVALGSSTLMIQLFTDGEGSHFWLNLAGVVIAALATGSILRRYRHHPFMHELLYVWQLKQQLNKIYRKQKAIKSAVEAGDRDAMVIMHFNYQGSRQLYLLDNNTLTLEELDRSIAELDATLQRHGIEVSLEEYRPELLDKF